MATDRTVMVDDLGSGSRGRRGGPFAAGTALDPELEVSLLDFKFRKAVLGHQFDDQLDFLEIHRRGVLWQLRERLFLVSDALEVKEFQL
jgi:hypothetical protein